MRYEDVEGPLGDDPGSLDVFRHERDWLDDLRPTKAETDADECDLRSWQRGNYSDGGGQ